MPLTASKNPYVIKGSDLDEGITPAPLRVRWDVDYDIQIWESFSGRDPHGSDPGFERRDLTDSEREEREISVALDPGTIYVALMFAKDFEVDPNEGFGDPEPADGMVTVPAVIDRYRKLLDFPDGFWAGGTYIGTWCSIENGLVEAWTSMQVGTTAPVVVAEGRDSDGNVIQLKKIQKPVAVENSFNSGSHELECKPLDPGQLYSVIVTAVDQQGNWDCVEETLNTKLRLVEIDFKKIKVINCGDKVNDVGQGKFTVNVKESGSVVDDNVVAQYSVGGDDYNIHNGQDILVDWRVRIGPKAIKPELNKTVSVHTHGKENDGILGYEHASSGFAPIILHFPAGSQQEAADFSEELRADPEDDNFRYKVFFEWKVTYLDP